MARSMWSTCSAGRYSESIPARRFQATGFRKNAGASRRFFDTSVATAIVSPQSAAYSPELPVSLPLDGSEFLFSSNCITLSG